MFDVDNDGKLDIVSGDTWYQAPDWKPYHVRDVDAGRAPITTISPRCRSTSTATATPTSSRAPISARTSAGSRTRESPARPGPITRSTCRATSRRPGWSTSPATACRTSCPTRSTSSSGTRSSRTATARGSTLKKHDLGKQAAGHGVGSGDVNGDGRVDLLTPKGWFEAPADPAHRHGPGIPTGSSAPPASRSWRATSTATGSPTSSTAWATTTGCSGCIRARAPAASAPGPSRRSTSRSRRSTR